MEVARWVMKREVDVVGGQKARRVSTAAGNALQASDWELDWALKA